MSDIIKCSYGGGGNNHQFQADWEQFNFQLIKLSDLVTQLVSSSRCINFFYFLFLQKKFPGRNQAREYSENQTNSLFRKEFDILLDSVAVKLDNPYFDKKSDWDNI